MIVQIGNKRYDPEQTPVALIFSDDTEREKVTGQLRDMEPKEGIRIWAKFSDIFRASDKFDKWWFKLIKPTSK